VALLGDLQRVVESGSFAGPVLIDDAWTRSTTGGALLEALRCAVPRERIFRLSSSIEVERTDAPERAIQQPVGRAELQALLGIAAGGENATEEASPAPVADAAPSIDAVGAVARFEGDHRLWITLLGQFAARYDRLPWRLGAELGGSGVPDVDARVRRIAGAAAALGLQRLAAALRDLSESLPLSDSMTRRRRIGEFLKAHSQTFADVRRLLASEGIGRSGGCGGPLDLMDPLRAA
jgi:hypothetical protein